MRSSTLLFFAVCMVVICGSNATPRRSGNKAPAVTEEEGFRPRSMEGWHSAPTEKPKTAKLESREIVVTPKKAKPGFCGSAKGFGIKCMFRIDQCMEDHQCPTVSKCCMVGACGYMCIKPKPTEDLVKEDVKPDLRKKDKKVSTTTTESYDENNESLKASDVIDMKDMKDMTDLVVEEISDKKKDIKTVKGSKRDG